MRKILAVLSVSVIVGCALGGPSFVVQASAPASASPAPAPKLVIRGLVIPAKADESYYLGGSSGQTLYAPARVVLTQLGYQLSWDESTRTLTASGNGQTLRHSPGTAQWKIDDSTYPLSEASLLRDGTLWVPAPLLAELVDAQTLWNPWSQTLFIKPGLTAMLSQTLALPPDRLRYDGESAENQRQGRGKLFADGVLWYNGEFAAGRMQGLGTLYDGDRVWYEGAFANGLPDGHGTYTYPDGSTYVGEFKAGRQSGRGYLYDSNRIRRYWGEWVNGLMQGSGELYGPDGSAQYAGQLRAGKRYGQGIAYAAGGARKEYDGLWQNDQRAGSGKAYDRDGRLAYDGGWKEDRRDGNGILYRIGDLDWIQSNDKGELIRVKQQATQMTEVRYRSGIQLSEGETRLYTGETLTDGVPHGKGELRQQTGAARSTSQGVVNESLVVYSGDFMQGRMSGAGKLYDTAGKPVYAGDIKNGKRHGFGQSFENGKLAYEGVWEDDVPHGKGRKYVYDAAFPGTSFEGNTTALLYEGMFNRGKLTEPLHIYKYTGTFKNGMPEGRGAQALLHDYKTQNAEPSASDLAARSGTLVYEGEFKNGLRQGLGKLYSGSALAYEGEFYKGNREGAGKAYEEGLVYVGPFKNDLKEGSANVYDKWGVLRFTGTFKNGLKSGYGKLYNDSGRLNYEGDFLNDKKHGYGKLYFYDGVTPSYQGEFREDQTLSDYLNGRR